MSAEPPLIVIRTAEERLAEEASKVCRFLLREFPSEDPTEEGICLRVSERPPEETYLPEVLSSEDVLRWWFTDYDAACAWAAVRARDLWREGIEVIDLPLVARTDFRDKRFPNKFDRRIYSSAPLKW